MFRERAAPGPISNENSYKAVHQTVRYYRDSQSYLEGPLQGTCHFGYSQPGERYELSAALRSMEILLGETLALPPGAKVIDAGCGYGRVAATLSKQFGYNVIGIDLIQERLKEARQHTTTHGDSQRVGMVNGSFCKLPIEDSSVSAVYTMETLVHADPLEAALDEFQRVLKPGGDVVHFEYAVPDQDKLDPIRRKITDVMVERTGMASIGRFTHGNLPKILHDANFENVTVKDISRNVWPTWRWLFWNAVRNDWKRILRGRFMERTNLAASLFIYPYRHQLGYNIITATKPYTPILN